MINERDLQDKNWRVNNLYKIKDKAKQIVQFHRNAAQEDFEKKKHTRNIILKSRQLGFTTNASIDMLDDVLWNPNFKALLLSYDQTSALDLFDEKIDFGWKHYPEEFQRLYVLDADRSSKLKFDFGNDIYSEVEVRTRARSGTYSRIHISEFGKICAESPAKADEIITGTVPAVPFDGRIDIESTAEGEIGDFHDMFWLAWNRGEPTSPVEWKAHFYNWQWDKEEIDRAPLLQVPDEFKKYQEKHKLIDKEISYYYQKYLSLGSKWGKLKQEYPTTPEEAFSYSGNKMFDPEKVASISFIESGEKSNNWIFYRPFKPNHVYVCGADVAEGVGQDSSTGEILDVTNSKIEQVAEYASNEIAPDLFAFDLKNGCSQYGNCLIGVERNNHGHATLATLKTIYPLNRIYAEVQEARTGEKQTDRLGWPSNLVTKPMMVYEATTIVNDELLKIYSSFLAQELKTYNKEDLVQIQFDPDQTKHWDRVIALCIALQMRKHLPKSDGGQKIVDAMKNHLEKVQAMQNPMRIPEKNAILERYRQAIKTGRQSF